MAPEQPGSLVILDMRDPATAGGCTAYRWIPRDASEELIVLWEASTAGGCPPDFVEAVGDVCVAAPPGFTEYRYTLDPSGNPLVHSWRGQVNGTYLMLIAILPAAHAFAEPVRGSAWPVKAKLVGDRMAVYWVFEGTGSTVEPVWRIHPVGDNGELADHCAAVNAQGEVPAPPEPPLPSAEVRRRWAAHRDDPIDAPPPGAA